ncbi:MAG TPA: asparagine synthase (glutamine-hydrolyzing) [Candidatus Limnocylindria bacterium]|nr:asparagine synthase (glutamine-hydrolyzing) [Candidatus Limnocylindria bacterium]
MCGIAGLAAWEIDPRFYGAAERMAAALGHRGPDSQGVQDLNECLLANTRLAIVDLSDRGSQPMCNEDATVWITYNGECYNAAELRPALLKRGHEFRSATDTEVILHLYEEYGDDFVTRLRGMFAFAIWDARAKKLLLARDRLGIKPLYFAIHRDTVLFASEIKALLASELLPRKLDPAGTRAFLELGHIPPPWSPIRGVRPLDPGHIGIWQEGGFRVKPYWRLPAPTKGKMQKRPGEVSSDLREILLESSRLQLMSDVPIALFLSGGVDSAVLGALMQRAGANQLTALTIGFEEESFDESDASQRTAELLGLSRRVIRLPASRITDSLDHAIWAMDQPTVDGINAYWISRAAAEAGFKVALSGQGGDELFGGYESLAWFDRFSHLAGWLRPVPQMVGRGLLDHAAFPFRWRKLSYLVGADDSFVAAQLAVRVLFPEVDVRALLTGELTRGNSHSEAAVHIQEWASQTKGQNLPERIAFLDFPAHLEARLLRDGDAMSMAHSLEVRPVLLDHAVVEYVMALPISLRLGKKQLLLDAVGKWLPPELHVDLCGRPKRGFTFPFARWLGGALRETIAGAFRPDRLAASGVLNSDTVQKLWCRYLENPESVGWSRVWSLFVLARWCEIMRVGV